MTGFFIKKSFYDGWDNILPIVVLNITLAVVAFGGFFLAQLAVQSTPVVVLIVVLAVMLEGVLLLAYSFVMARVADFRSFGMKDILDAIRKTWVHGMLYSIVGAGVLFLLKMSSDYYRGLDTTVGFVLFLAVFWITIIFLLSFQWFLPIRTQLEDNFFKCIKKCFIIFLDNPGFSIFMFFYQIIVAILSVVALLLIPGVVGIILAQNNAFRLLMYKYDWLEKNPDIDYKSIRKSLPWNELLADDIESLGNRTFRNFLFPWIK